MWQYVSYTELYHHGIKGQKWGVRRFQNVDGSLTPEGKKRYDIPDDKSKHRVNLEVNYLKKGYSKEQAEQAAAKRIKAEKFVVVAAAATVASIAYKKYVDNGKDFTISKNTDLQRIIRLDRDTDPFKGTREYVSYTKLDNMKYTGFMGKFEGGTAKAMNKGLDQIKEKHPGIKLTQNYQEMYKMKITPKQDIKVASVNRAKNTFVDLYKNDKEFKNMYDKWMTDFSTNQPNSTHKTFKQFAKAVKNGSVSDKFLETVGYKAFNVSIAEKDDISNNIQRKFYDSLVRQGMNAVVDLNDKQGLLKTSKPIITFDGGYDYSKKVLSDKEINKSLALSVPVVLAQNLAKPAAMALVSLYAKNTVSNARKNDEAIREYKKDHPNTKKTDEEILYMLNSKS